METETVPEPLLNAVWRGSGTKHFCSQRTLLQKLAHYSGEKSVFSVFYS